MTSNNLRRTALFENHQNLKARFTNFAGWEMPVQYSSILEEHQAVRSRAGLFDISHMALVDICGKNAAAFLDSMTCNHVATMADNQVRYNALTTPQGGLVDDITIYRYGSEQYQLIVNSSNEDAVYQILEKNLPDDLELINLNHNYVLLALQGPLAEKIASHLFNNNLSDLNYFHFKEIEYLSEKVIVSRTGYTGEDGFEIAAPLSIGSRLWESLINDYSGEGLLPAGFAVRDILRLEAFYPLYGSELNAEWTPEESGIGWVAREKESPYPGYERIIKDKKAGVTHQVQGLIMEERAIPRQGCQVFEASGEKAIGTILSGGFSPALQKGIASSYLPKLEAGARVVVEIRSKKLAASIHHGSFVRGGAGKK